MKRKSLELTLRLWIKRL